jgi:hypothetical protein
MAAATTITEPRSRPYGVVMTWDRATRYADAGTTRMVMLS